MTTRLASQEGRVLGGAGLITVEMGSPERAGRHRFRELGVYDDQFIPGLERLTSALRDSGSRVSV